jgi:hypothetical protein
MMSETGHGGLIRLDLPRLSFTWMRLAEFNSGRLAGATKSENRVDANDPQAPLNELNKAGVICCC